MCSSNGCLSLQEKNATCWKTSPYRTIPYSFKLGQYRTKLVRKVRCQIFRQIALGFFILLSISLFWKRSYALCLRFIKVQ